MVKPGYGEKSFGRENATFLFFCTAMVIGEAGGCLVLACRLRYLAWGHRFVTFIRASLSETDFRQGSTLRVLCEWVASAGCSRGWRQ